jgi:hypothetical protein
MVCEYFIILFSLIDFIYVCANCFWNEKKKKTIVYNQHNNFFIWKEDFLYDWNHTKLMEKKKHFFLRSD